MDVAFESQDEETAAIVNKHLQSDDKQDLTITNDEPSISTHTVFGYLFIRKQLVSHSNFTHDYIVSITDPHLRMRDLDLEINTSHYSHSHHLICHIITYTNINVFQYIDSKYVSASCIALNYSAFPPSVNSFPLPPQPPPPISILQSV